MSELNTVFRIEMRYRCDYLSDTSRCNFYLTSTTKCQVSREDVLGQICFTF
jgi:CRISPR/Cas system-associated protein Csm6